MKNVAKMMLSMLMMTAVSTQVVAMDNDKQQEKKHMSREELAVRQGQKIAHQLALDDATSQKFQQTWQEYQKELWALGPKHHQKGGRPDATDGDKKERETKNITEAEAEKMIKNQFEHSRKLLDLREKYYKQYSKFLTQKQILRVYEIERHSMQGFAHPGGGHKGKPDGIRPRRGDSKMKQQDNK